MNQITLEVSQPTDSNILNSGSLEVEGKSSSTFSNLMEQHNTERQSGNKAIKDGNDEPKYSASSKRDEIKDSATSGDDAISEDKSEPTIEAKDTADTSVEKNKTKSDVSDNDQITEEDAKENLEADATVNNTEVAENTHNPEQLLSFLNASEKALVNSEQKVKPADVNSLTPTVEELQLETDAEVETNKTLIAQSVSTDKNIADVKSLKAASENIATDNKLTDVETNEDITKETIKPDTQLTSKIMTDKSIDTTAKVKNDTQIEGATKLQSETTVVVEELNSLSQEYQTESNKQQLSQSELLVTPQNKLSQAANVSEISGQKVDVSSKVIQSNEQLSQEALKAATGETLDENKLKSVASVLPINTEQVLKQTKETSTASSIKSDNNAKVEESLAFSETSSDELLFDEPKLKTPEVKLAQTLTPIASALFKSELDNQSRLDMSTQDEHSFENVMQTMSSDLTQTQKNTVIQQTETIALMRKDAIDAVKEKVMVMINQKIQQIDIQLDPPELGNMQVRINMQNEQAVVNFVVQNQQAKDALEQNMDKLKHMMSESGVDVGDANVDQQSKQSSAEKQNEQGTNDSFNNQEGTSQAFIASENAKVIKASSTGVDYYV